MAVVATSETHRSAVAHATIDAGAVVFDSQAELAEWLGTHRSQITRVARGQELGGEPGWRLSGLTAVVVALLSLYEPDAIAGWMRGSNPYLNGRRPLDVLAAGDVAGVMVAVQATRTGAYA